MDNNYDLVVIGAGPGGYVSAIKASKLGMKVAVIEKDELGGTCLNRGCIPTKSLIHATELYRDIQNSEMYGITHGEIDYDVEKMYLYKDGVVEKLRKGIAQLFKANNITLFKGVGKIYKDNIVKIKSDDEEIEVKGDKILIATGSKPIIPKIPGVNSSGIITSDDILSNSKVKNDKLIIIGGGVIGVEFATIFAALGKEVTIIEALPRLLPNIDKEISQNLKMILKKRKIKIYTDSLVESISKDNDKVICNFKEKDKLISLDGDSVLVAIGRASYFEGLFDESINIEIDRNKIVVDDNFETSIKGIYAIGDTIEGTQLAHVASAEGIVAIEKMNKIVPDINLEVVPSCVYTNPEIASVGMTEDEAKEKGISVVVGKTLTSSNGKSIVSNDERGVIKLIFEEKSHIIIGAHMMCSRATDMIGEMSTAIANKLTDKHLSKAMKAHPTYNEAIIEAVEDAFGESIHGKIKK